MASRYFFWFGHHGVGHDVQHWVEHFAQKPKYFNPGIPKNWHGPGLERWVGSCSQKDGFQPKCPERVGRGQGIGWNIAPKSGDCSPGMLKKSRCGERGRALGAALPER